MRFSADHKSPDYRPDLIGRIEVFLDGQRLQKIRAFDSDEGWVIQFVLDDAGRFIQDPNAPDQMLMRKLHGAIEVRIRDEL